MTVTLAVLFILAGCGRDNGLPGELKSHLAGHGIVIVPARVHAPLSARGGYVVTRHEPKLATNIISTFSLQRIRPDERQWGFAIARAGGAAAPKELWGVAGRPAQFKLKSGGQFEYFFLFVTEDGWMYLIAEYAYG